MLGHDKTYDKRKQRLQQAIVTACILVVFKMCIVVEISSSVVLFLLWAIRFEVACGCIFYASAALPSALSFFDLPIRMIAF